MMMHKDFCFHGKWLGLFFLTLAGLSFLWISCGKKGPPRPPQRRSPPAVKDLSYVVDNRIVELSWTYKVFRSKLSAAESNCEKCPIRFEEIADVPVQMKRSEKSKPTRLRFTEVLEPGYRYIYKVIAYDKEGESSADSNIIKFDHE
jgi:hypothetical protein